MKTDWLDADFYEGLAAKMRLASRPFEDRVEDFSVADEEGKIRRFRWRAVQQAYWRRRKNARRVIVLKARRHGITTIELLRAYDALKWGSNQRMVFLANSYDNTRAIFANAHVYFDTDPHQPRLRGGKPSASAFTAYNGSSLYIGTAGSRSFGRGTTLQRVHGSEVAFWEGKTERLQVLLAGLTEAASHGHITLESTANGFDALFRPIWVDAEKRGFKRVFLPWFINPAYSDPVLDKNEFIAGLTKEERVIAEKYLLDPGQIAWRRRKKSELGVFFEQEYPGEPDEAFISSGSGLYTAHDGGTALRQAINSAPRPVREIGSFESGGEQWFLSEPRPGMGYLIAADSAEGHADGDYSAFSVRDELGAQIGVGQYRIPTHVFAKRLVEIARFWNNALIIPESNSIGQALIETLVETCQYDNIYRERRWNGSMWIEAASYGFRTTETTRSIAVQAHLAAFLAGDLHLPSKWLLGQMATIARSSTGKWEGAEHDDLWMADLIALQGIHFGLQANQQAGPQNISNLFRI